MAKDYMKKNKAEMAWKAAYIKSRGGLAESGGRSSSEGLENFPSQSELSEESDNRTNEGRISSGDVSSSAFGR